jgi:hypothetical protein
MSAWRHQRKFGSGRMNWNVGGNRSFPSPRRWRKLVWKRKFWAMGRVTGRFGSQQCDEFHPHQIKYILSRRPHGATLTAAAT